MLGSKKHEILLFWIGKTIGELRLKTAELISLNIRG